MPSNDREVRLKEAVVFSLRADRLDDALRTAQSLAETNGDDPEVHQILGLTHTRLENRDEAGKAFSRAVELAPTEPKHRYNLAIHLRAMGDFEDARLQAEEAVRLYPAYREAQSLIDELDGKVVVPSPRVHLLPWLRGKEEVWDRTAYLVLALGLLLSLLLIFHFPAAPTGNPVKQGELPDVGLRQDPLSQFTVFLYVLSSGLTFMWMLADVVDRKKKFTWLVPVSICGVLGMNVVAMGLYFFAGRKFGEDSENAL